MKKVLLLVMLLCLSVTLATAQDSAPAPDVLYVNTTEPLGAISPYIFGANMGLYSIIPMALMPEAEALNLNYIRFGGGDSDQQDIRENVIDTFVLQVRLTGAEPAITVRLLGGSPEHAAEIVRYTNIEKEYDVRYWSIGNEPNLFVALMGVETFTTDDLNQQWRAIAEAMLEVDPTIMFVGPDVTQVVPLSVEGDSVTYLENRLGGHPFDAQGNDWLQDFLRANGDLISIVSIHRYPYPGASGDGTGATIDGLRENSREWDVIIPNLREIIRNAAGRDIPIGVTEFNSNSANSVGGEASLDSFYNAIWMGDVLGRLINQKVEVAAVWDMQGGPGRGWGLLGSYDVRPPYYAYLMYTHFGTELLGAQSGDPDVSIYAAEADDGALTLMVINLGADEQTKTLALDGFTGSSEAEVWRFDAERNAESIDPQTIADGTEITVPGQSMTLYRIPRPA